MPNLDTNGTHSRIRISTLAITPRNGVHAWTIRRLAGRNYASVPVGNERHSLSSLQISPRLAAIVVAESQPSQNGILSFSSPVSPIPKPAYSIQVKPTVHRARRRTRPTCVQGEFFRLSRTSVPEIWGTIRKESATITWKIRKFRITSRYKMLSDCLRNTLPFEQRQCSRARTGSPSLRAPSRHFSFVFFKGREPNRNK